MDDELHKLAKQVGIKFKHANQKIVTAESCTGGGVSYILTSIAGSSDWFDRGYVTYSNEAKIELLDVNINTLNQYGAVSEETALAMAIGALKHSHADIAISVTGIAGPDGGSAEKPVGTVWIGLASKEKTLATANQFHGDRESIRLQTIKSALELLLN